MPKASPTRNAVVEKLDAILQVLESLLILESAKAGIKRDGIRDFLPVDNNRISRVAKYVRRKNDLSKEIAIRSK
jgi:hypothetical protein